jgi:FtsZ-interacting cell division protein ZipA
MTTVIIIAVIVVLVVVGLAIWAGSRRNARLTDERRDAAAAHREEALRRAEQADQAELAAKEQAARAERQRLEAEEQSRRAESERVAAGQHERQASEIDPDTDDR